MVIQKPATAKRLRKTRKHEHLLFVPPTSAVHSSFLIVFFAVATPPPELPQVFHRRSPWREWGYAYMSLALGYRR